MSVQSALQDQYDVVLDRKQNPGGEKSYTNYLYSQGLNKILKKCGEECFETVIAVKTGDTDEILGELGDLFYHVTVMMCDCGVTLDQVMEALNVRCQTEGKSFDVLSDVVAARRGLPVDEDAKEGSSYTAYLFQKGTDKILKKIGEACSLMLLAAKDQDQEKIAYEVGSLFYHVMVMMENEGLSTQQLGEKLDARNGKTGNLKVFHQTNVNS